MNDKPQNIADDEIDLRDLFLAFWQGKWIIIAITVLFGVLSVIYAINQPNMYKSFAVLVPADEQSQGGMSALAGQFGGLASLAGVNLGGNSSTNKAQLALEVLKSRQFVADFIEKHSILPDLMAVEEWERSSNVIKYDNELYSEDDDKWLREVQPPYQPEPSMQEAFKIFREVVAADIDEESGIIVISVIHQSPIIAQRWVSWLIEDINSVMKARDVKEANRSTDFLMQQLKQTQIADIRTVLYKLIEEQAKTIMFANVRDEYVFKTIDPALVPEEKSGPKRAIICIIGTIIGGILSTLFVLIRYFSINKTN